MNLLPKCFSLRLRRILATVLALSAGLGGVSAPVAEAHFESVMSGYYRAQKAASAGQAESAVQILVRLLQHFPNHEPRRLLLAHLQLTPGHFGKAVILYRRLSPSMVTQGLGYECGLTFFSVKHCSRAVRGFSRVPPQSREAGLASLYIGICSLNLGDCQKAELYLSNAKGLPAILEPGRKKALARASSRAFGEMAKYSGPTLLI